MSRRQSQRKNNMNLHYQCTNRHATCRREDYTDRAGTRMETSAGVPHISTAENENAQCPKPCAWRSRRIKGIWAVGSMSYATALQRHPSPYYRVLMIVIVGSLNRTVIKKCNHNAMLIKWMLLAMPMEQCLQIWHESLVVLALWLLS